MQWGEFKEMMDKKGVCDDDEMTFVTHAKGRGDDTRLRVEFQDVEIRSQVDIGPRHYHARIVFQR